MHLKAALLLVALLGTATILLTYLLARRLAGPIAGLIAALLAATYPAFIDNNGRLLAEPVALFWLPAAMLAFLWASDGGRAVALAGPRRAARADHAHPARSTCRSSPLFALLALAARVARPPPRLRSPAIAAAALLVVAFCAVAGPVDGAQHLTLDRFVPVTTGGGKALFVATYLPGDGRQQLVKRQLIARYYGKKDLPYTRGPADGDGSRCSTGSRRSTRTWRATPRWPASGARTSSSTRREQPLDYAWMVIRKIQNMWDRGSSADDVAEVLVRLPQGAGVLGAGGADRARVAAPLGGACRSASRSSASR